MKSVITCQDVNNPQCAYLNNRYCEYSGYCELQRPRDNRKLVEINDS